jgi:hypothetical protein
MRQALALMGALVVGGSGCSMIGVSQSAKTAGDDAVQVGLEPGAWGGAGEGGSAFFPGFNVALRYGISDRVDIGGRLGAGMPQITAKVMFTDPTVDGLQMSIAPMFGLFYMAAGGAGAGYVDVNVPVLIGLPAGKSEVVLGPRVHVQSVLGAAGGSSAGAGFLSAGTSIGYAAQIGEHFKIITEVTGEYPFFVFAAAGGDSASATTDFDGLFMNYGVAFVFGGR